MLLLLSFESLFEFVSLVLLLSEVSFLLCLDTLFLLLLFFIVFLFLFCLDILVLELLFELLFLFILFGILILILSSLF